MIQNQIEIQLPIHSSIMSAPLQCLFHHWYLLAKERKKLCVAMQGKLKRMHPPLITLVFQPLQADGPILPFDRFLLNIPLRTRPTIENNRIPPFLQLSNKSLWLHLKTQFTVLCPKHNSEVSQQHSTNCHKIENKHTNYKYTLCCVFHISILLPTTQQKCPTITSKFKKDIIAQLERQIHQHLRINQNKI